MYIIQFAMVVEIEKNNIRKNECTCTDKHVNSREKH